MSEKFPIVNIMEDIVDIKVENTIDSMDMCQCGRCRADSKALALNKLVPKYVVSISGNVLSKMQATTVQRQAEIMVAVIEAVKMVDKRPNHSRDDIVKRANP